MSSGKTSIISLSCLESCFKFLNYIYFNYDIDKIGFKRKYNKYRLIKERFDFMQSKQIENLNIPLISNENIGIKNERRGNLYQTIYEIIKLNNNKISFSSLLKIVPAPRSRISYVINLLKKDKKIKSINNYINQVYQVQ